MGTLTLFLGLVFAAGAGFLAAWLLRGHAMEKSANYASSLEQLVAGLMRERDALLERERARTRELERADGKVQTRVRELEKELEHRETQSIAFREEAIHLARAREEVAQRLARQEQRTREVEETLTARIQELLEHAGRTPGTRLTGGERELASLMAAHETDLAELEARYLQLIQSKDAEIERLRTARQSQSAMVSRADEEPLPAPVAEEPRLAAAPDPPPSRSPNGTAPGSTRARRKRRHSRDDLKQISGIDESVEQALHLVGVTSFRQVARWKDKDVERMAKKLYQPVERIRTEQWVEKAREAYSRKYGGPV